VVSVGATVLVVTLVEGCAEVVDVPGLVVAVPSEPPGPVEHAPMMRARVASTFRLLLTG
jgi:hypothetical protein